MNTPLSNIRLARDFLEADHPDWSEEHYHAQLKRKPKCHAPRHRSFARAERLNENAVIQANQYAQEDIHLRQWLELWQEEQVKADAHIKIRLAVHSYLMDWPTLSRSTSNRLNPAVAIQQKRNPDLLSKGALKVNVEWRERSEF